MKGPISLAAILLLAGCTVAPTNSTSTATTPTTNTVIASLTPYADTSGTVSTYASGGVDTSAIFFQPLGTNGRTCATCHQLAQGMSLNTTSIQALFASSAGADPLFAAVDGANCSTVATGSQSGHSLILNNGLIRIAMPGIAMPVPAAAQFTLSVVQDPYGCALTTSASGAQTVSVYRRPLPTASVSYLSNVMWDTRETGVPLTALATLSANLENDLTQQAIDAVSTHEQGSATPTSAQTAAIIGMMEGMFTAQATDNNAGSLTANGATGGALALASANYYPGINDAFGGDPTGAKFNPNIFTLFQSWNNSASAAQASIARGEQIFNNAPMVLTNVRGINDNAALGSPAALPGSCETCHDAPQIGHHSVPLPLDTAIARLAQYETDPNTLAGIAQLAAPSLPVYKIAGCANAAGQAVAYYTSDPGKGLVTGLCADVSRMKVPMLRGLAARAPYFHNGSARSLAQVVSFYNARFQMKLNPQQQADLVNFLSAL